MKPRNVAAVLPAALRESGDTDRWWATEIAHWDIRHVHEDGLAIIPNMRDTWRVGVKR